MPEPTVQQNPIKQVIVEVDSDEVTSPRDTTVGDLLRAAHLDPSTRQLVLVQGRRSTEYPDPTSKLTLHSGERFITLAIGPTPVS